MKRFLIHRSRPACQAKSVVHLGVGAELITLGHHAYRAPIVNGAVILPSGSRPRFLSELARAKPPTPAAAEDAGGVGGGARALASASASETHVPTPCSETVDDDKSLPRAPGEVSPGSLRAAGNVTLDQLQRELKSAVDISLSGAMDASLSGLASLDDSVSRLGAALGGCANTPAPASVPAPAARAWPSFRKRRQTERVAGSRGAPHGSLDDSFTCRLARALGGATEDEPTPRNAPRASPRRVASIGAHLLGSDDGGTLGGGDIGSGGDDNASACSVDALLRQHAVVEALFEGRAASLERLVAFYVLFHAMAQRVSTAFTWCGLGYDMWRSQSGTRVQTTPAPVTVTGAPEEAAAAAVTTEEHACDESARARNASGASVALAGLPLEYVATAAELGLRHRDAAPPLRCVGVMSGAARGGASSLANGSEFLHCISSDVLDALDESMHRIRARVPSIDRSLHSLDVSLRGI